MEFIGAEILHNKWGVGKVKAFNVKELLVDFPEKKEAKLAFPDVVVKYKLAKFTDEELQAAVIADYKEKKKAAVKPDPLENVTPLKVEPQNPNKPNKPKGDWPVLKMPQRNNNPLTFIVFQGRTFDNECAGGYIWAPIYDSAGKRPHHWERMEAIRKGDIILNVSKDGIRAVSIAKGQCHPCDRPVAFKELEQWEKNGLRVDCDYFVLKNPVRHGDYKDEILKYSRVKYSPFNKQGTGNQGYLFEIDKELAKFFIEIAKKQNPGLLNGGFEL